MVFFRLGLELNIVHAFDQRDLGWWFCGQEYLLLFGIVDILDNLFGESSKGGIIEARRFQSNLL